MVADRKKFKIDARAMLTWGRESIKDPITAIVELVKNGYDAGASVVEVNVRTQAKPEERYIRVADDGEGMGEREVDAYWLRLGFSMKRNETTAHGRRRTGEKGIGRVSADRLGGILELRTQKKNKPVFGLVVDWSAYEKPGQELSDIELETLEAPTFEVPRPERRGEGEYQEAPAPEANSRKRTGTELLIRQLRDKWTKDDVTDLRRALSALTPPFGESHGFQIRLVADLGGDEQATVTSPFYEAAELTGEFCINKRGSISYSFTGRDKRGKRSPTGKETVRWAQFTHRGTESGDTDSECPAFGPAKVSLLFYPRTTTTLRGTDLLLGNLKRFLDVHSGVKVYRDQIRVMPYGDPGKPEGDWLGLGDRKARGPAGPARQDYRVSPNQLVGAVYLSRDKNPGIADTSGREGLVHGDDYDELRAFIIGCIVRLELEYHRRFSKQKVKKEEPDPREAVRDLKVQLTKLATSLKRLRTSIPDSARPEFEEASAQVTTTQQAITDTEKSLDELAGYATVFRGIASLGIAAATFGHETLGSIDGVKLFVGTALDSLEEDDLDVAGIVDELEKAIRATDRISAWGRFTLGRVRKDKRRRQTIKIDELVSTLLDEISRPFEVSSITIRRSLRSVSGKVFPMDIEAVLVNLLTNAYYFVKRSKRKRTVRVVLRPSRYEGRDGFKMTVSDSGPGIQRDIQEQIWRPLMTTRVDDKNKGIGTGLGLAIVDATVQDLGGWRDVGRDDVLHGAQFTIWLPVG